MSRIREPGTLTTVEVEAIEKLTLASVYQAVVDFGFDAWDIFFQSPDAVKDVAEDITRELLDKFSGYQIHQRILGNVDYRTARYVLLPEYGVRQALFVDSKAEKSASSGTMQMSQLSMRVRQVRAGANLDEPGQLTPISVYKAKNYVTTTVLVHYHYKEQQLADPAHLPAEVDTTIPEADPELDADALDAEAEGQESAEEQEVEIIDANAPVRHVLKHVTVAAVPSGFLQDTYNPTAGDGIWNVGRNAPKLGEDFRVRVAFAKLQKKAAWRVQRIAYDHTKAQLVHEWKD